MSTERHRYQGAGRSADPAWAEFLEAVLQAEEANERELKRCRDTNAFRTPMFEFAKRLRNHPMLISLSAEEAAERVEDALNEVHVLEEEDLIWQLVFGDTDSEGDQIDPYSDFICCWDKFLQPGTGVLEKAVEQARANPRRPAYFGEWLNGRKHAKFREFLTVLEELQKARGEAPIFLSRDLLKDLMKTSRKQIDRWMYMARRDGFLRLEKEHQRGKAAAEYRFQIPKQKPARACVSPEHQNHRSPDTQTNRPPDNQTKRTPDSQTSRPTDSQKARAVDLRRKSPSDSDEDIPY